MAGHSKWANIKHRKGAIDAKRGKVFTRIAREIIIAARLGGGDQNANPRLRLAVQKARAVNMPNDNINRAIQKGTGELEGQQMEELILEGYGPGGIGILMECVTDNRNRTVADVRKILSRNGGSMADAGAVAWNFSRRTLISVRQEGTTEEEVLLAVLDAGAEDVRTGEETFDVQAPVENFETIRAALDAAGCTIAEANLQYVPNQTLELTGEQAAAALKLLDLLDDYDDVQDLYSNLEVSEEEMAKIEG
ncbi:MAG: YebC/PmpR family DNA-binding transcriptional regulator [Chlorobi bacterium]|nr:MAG: Transcriptional regulator [Chlorobi bacterium OLB7]MBK8911991.1 YebC/PmpR family DNA-binding transcriptional regulator [Chlorobiota bacterium]MBX7215371.1 YebC/PmpR family DNA-binding transcriptional regulator [Candidatus Kapabacteria bacterium]